MGPEYRKTVGPDPAKQTQPTAGLGNGEHGQGAKGPVPGSRFPVPCLLRNKANPSVAESLFPVPRSQGPCETKPMGDPASRSTCASRKRTFCSKSFSDMLLRKHEIGFGRQNSVPAPLPRLPSPRIPRRAFGSCRHAVFRSSGNPVFQSSRLGHALSPRALTSSGSGGSSAVLPRGPLGNPLSSIHLVERIVPSIIALSRK